jgi:hypothetical protein
MTTESHRVNNNTTEGHYVSKSQLPYLLKEALETGGWELTDQTSTIETFIRGSETVKIGVKALRSTNPASYVYEISDPETKTHRTTMTVINSLCSLLAKSGKMSDPSATVSTTTE